MIKVQFRIPGEIIAIPKPGKPVDNINSLHPFVKSSCLRKSFEKLLKNRIDYSIETNNIGL